MSGFSFKITTENINKFVPTFEENVNKIQDTPYLDELFKNLQNAKMHNLDEAEAVAVAKESKEAKADEKTQERTKNL